MAHDLRFAALVAQNVETLGLAIAARAVLAAGVLLRLAAAGLPLGRRVVRRELALAQPPRPIGPVALVRAHLQQRLFTRCRLPRFAPGRNFLNVDQLVDVIVAARVRMAALLRAEHLLQHRNVPVVDACRFAVRFESNRDLQKHTHTQRPQTAGLANEDTVREGAAAEAPQSYLLADVRNAVQRGVVRVVVRIRGQLDDIHVRIVRTAVVAGFLRQPLLVVVGRGTYLAQAELAAKSVHATKCRTSVSNAQFRNWRNLFTIAVIRPRASVRKK